MEFFETEEDCFSWIEEVISARKNTDLSPSTLESDDAPLRDERISKAKAELAKLKEEEEQQRKVTDTTKKIPLYYPILQHLKIKNTRPSHRTWKA